MLMNMMESVLTVERNGMMNNLLDRMEELGWEYIETLAGGFYRKNEKHIEGDDEWKKDVAIVKQLFR